jgi:hypothetical protein
MKFTFQCPRFREIQGPTPSIKVLLKNFHAGKCIYKTEQDIVLISRQFQFPILAIT